MLKHIRHLLPTPSFSAVTDYSGELTSGERGTKNGRKAWDPSFPLENTKSPHPETWKSTQKITIGPPKTVLKMTEKYVKKYYKCKFSVLVV